MRHARNATIPALEMKRRGGGEAERRRGGEAERRRGGEANRHISMYEEERHVSMYIMTVSNVYDYA